MRLLLFAILFIGFCSCTARPRYNLDSLVIPSDYKFEHGQGDDSYTGRITRADGHLITFDAGIGAGLAAHPTERTRHKFLWWREQQIGGAPVWLGIRDDGSQGRWLFVTFSADGANFWTQVTSEADIADALSIILTYKPRRA
ncbi:MAG: hypothetical protein WCV00_11340 [Verrucomicrobiia bacterium]|jgi:hypothetical protein